MSDGKRRFPRQTLPWVAFSQQCYLQVSEFLEQASSGERAAAGPGRRIIQRSMKLAGGAGQDRLSVHRHGRGKARRDILRVPPGSRASPDLTQREGDGSKLESKSSLRSHIGPYPSTEISRLLRAFRSATAADADSSTGTRMDIPSRSGVDLRKLVNHPLVAQREYLTSHLMRLEVKNTRTTILSC